ncbi:9814_t:CDS:2 [Funneliformis geosporum]|uniref:9814_t:CDS:1 n=1 Tax=Funneliformis geosporum TaxID=1117311 RepID=A0A9W4WXZ6_9GLOM|nr:9814_t:CDS:2 [Funneliformis geosporum]
MTDAAIINGDTAEYFSSNPAGGAKYKSPRKTGGMKWDNDKVYKCVVPVIVDEVFQTKITKDMLRIATGSSEKAEMIAALQANNLRKKLNMTIMSKCVEVICQKDNFSAESYIEMEEKDFNNAGKFLKVLFSAAEMMKHPTDKFNKGFKKKNGDYEKTIYSSGKLKNMIIVLDTEKKTDLRMEGSKTYNYTLVDLQREFKSVHDTILPEGVGALIMDHENDPLTKKVSLPGFVVGGPISFANMAIIVNKGKVATSTKPKKDILVDFAELEDDSDKMTKKQSEEWNNKGFTFEQAKEWLGAGLLVSDAKLAD